MHGSTAVVPIVRVVVMSAHSGSELSCASYNFQGGDCQMGSTAVISSLCAGFFQSYNDSTLAGNVTEAVRQLIADHPRTPLYITGHSMGSAMATVAALYLKFSLDLPDVRLYTFGSPRVGNDIFSEFFRSQITVSFGIGRRGLLQ